MTTTPARIATLRAELRWDSPAVATPTPRLSWTVETDEPGWVQAWTELRDGSGTVRLDGRDSVLVPWPFRPLAAGEVREIAVRAGSVDGAVTGWSDPLSVAASFVAEWVALPIGLAEPERIAQPALLRRGFELDRPVRRAVLHYAALGAIEVELNGHPADDTVLAPAWTAFHERLIHESSDVTGLLRTGANAIGIRLAGGWYTEEFSVVGPRRRLYGEQPRALAQLELDFEDGSRTMIATGEGWRSWGGGSTVDSGVYAGEHADARREPVGWSAPGFDESGWAGSLVDPRPLPVPEARVAPPVRRIESVPVREVLRSPSGATILDFGQNLVGRLRIRVTGAAGTAITLRHAEVLEDGELALRPLRGAKATDTFVLAGGGEEVFEPRFTFHGFRFAQVDGWPGDLDPGAVEAIVLHADMRRTGWFESSDERLDRLHENTVWSMRGNYLSVPMDCPQRDERLGWTGDTQLFAPTAAYLYDCHAFYASWLRELALEQRRLDGVVPLFAPNVVPHVGGRGPVAGWGDTMAIMPPLLAKRFGDPALLAELWPAIRAWADVLLGVRDAEGLWTSGRQLGDWLDPAAPPNAPARSRTDVDLVASAYLAHSLGIAAEVAAELGEAEDSARLAAAAERGRSAFAAAFVTPSGRMTSDTQTAYALALELGVVTDPTLRQRLADRLATIVRRDGYVIGAGIVGTPHLANALDHGGHLEELERLLFQTERPSWLYPITVGATTMWERWDGLLPDGTLNPGAMISFNHVVLGAVVEWLYAGVAGISPAERGWRRVRIAPRPLRRLSHASVRHLTPYGPVESAWWRDGGELRLRVAVPPNTTASVALFDLEVEVGSGVHEWRVAEPPAPVAAPVTLDSSTAELIDDETAFAAFWPALATGNPFLGTMVRLNAQWVPGRSIRDLLVFADQRTLDTVAEALAAVAPTGGPQ